MVSSDQTNLAAQMIGLIVAGRYQLLELLGAGAYGLVFKAIDIAATSEKPLYYAIKALQVPESDSARELQAKETALHVLVTGHDNFIGLHNVYQEQDRLFLVMDLCEGATLQDVLGDEMFYNSPDRDERVRSLFLAVLAGVKHIHVNEVYHRDLKPENILCSKGGTDVRIADFGLATDQRRTGTRGCGTAPYISPEAFVALVTYPYCQDLWALGIILINLVSRRSPWEMATHEDELFRFYVKNPHRYLSLLGLSDELANLIVEILAMNPLKRLHASEIRDRVIKIKSFFKTPITVANEGKPVPIANEGKSSISTTNGSKSCSATALAFISTGLSSPSTSSTSDTEGPSTPESGSTYIGDTILKDDAQAEIDITEVVSSTVPEVMVVDSLSSRTSSAPSAPSTSSRPNVSQPSPISPMNVVEQTAPLPLEKPSFARLIMSWLCIASPSIPSQRVADKN